MKLSLYTDSALRVLMYVAAHQDKRCTRVEIAAYFDLSVDHLRKVIHQLNLWGYLQTFPGRAGGFELGKPATEINIGQLIEQTEQQKHLFDCQGQACRLLPACRLNQVLHEAQQAFFESLQQYTLADLIDDSRLQYLLDAK